MTWGINSSTKLPVSKSKSAADSAAERVGWLAAAVPL
jgi:hypothetical protein